jgi:uncharacterized protein YciI
MTHLRPPCWKLLILPTLLCCSLLATASSADEKPSAQGTQEAKAKPPQAEKKIEFDKHYLILLRRGPAWTPEVTPEVEKLQAEHLAHMGRMAEAGKLVAAGPFGEQQDPTLRGMCLYRTETLEEARQLAEQDPAVKAGRLKVEVMAWYTEKGYLAFPKAVEKK